MSTGSITAMASFRDSARHQTRNFWPTGILMVTVLLTLAAPLPTGGHGDAVPSQQPGSLEE